MVATAHENAKSAAFQSIGRGVEVDHETATVRVRADVVAPTKLDYVDSLMPVVGLDRPDGDPRADALAYLKCSHEDGYVYVDTASVKRMTGEPMRKPIGYGLEDEVQAETAGAMDLVDEVYLRRAL